MAYTNPLKIANGLVLDFTLDAANTANDSFLGVNTDGEVTSFASVPRSRVSGGGNVTEATSAVLTITGGTAAVLTSGLTIQVLQAGAAQSGYLSTTDWNTFNNKLGTSLTSTYIFVGNGSNVATGVNVTGDISISNAGVVSIASGVIVNADINASAAIAVSKLAAVTANRVLGSDGSGFIQALDTATYPSLTELSYVKGVTSSLQTQLSTKLTVSLSSPSLGDVITYDGADWVNSPSGAGVPSGGTAEQILRKIDGVDYNTEWHTLVLADITDVSSNAAELNLLDGVTTTTAQFNFLNTTVADVQSQIDALLSKTLVENYIFVGNSSNIATGLAPGANGYVLTSVSGVPTWANPGSGGTVTSVAASGGTTGMSFTGSPITTTGTLTLTGTLALANGGTGASLADPGADRILFWDDSAGAATWLTVGTGLTITTTTLTANVSGSGTTNEIAYWTGSGTLGALAVATYPSLTELSYVKGLTSAVQTQLDAKLTDPMTTRGDIIYRNASNVTARLPIGANTYVLTSDGTDVSWAAPAGGGVWGSITGTLSAQTDLQSALDLKLNKAGDTYTTTSGNGLDLTSSTVTSGNLVSLSNTGTAAASNTKTVLNVSSSGANATSTQTTYASQFSNTNTGTASTNIGLYATASGGTNNYAAIFSSGSVGIGTTAPTRQFEINMPTHTFGFKIGSTNSTTRFLELGTNGTSSIINYNSGTLLFQENGSTIGSLDAAVFAMPAGTVGAPGLAFFNNISVGLYQIGGSGTEEFAAATNGSAKMGWASGHVYVPASVGFALGASTMISSSNKLEITGTGNSTDKTLLLQQNGGTDTFAFQDDGNAFIYITPTKDNAATQVLTRNSGTGAIEYKDASVLFSSSAMGVEDVVYNHGELGSASTSSSSIHVNAYYSNKTALYVEVKVVAIKTDGTSSASATVSGRFRKDNSGTFNLDENGTVVTSDAAIIADVDLEVNGTNPAVKVTMGASSGTYEVSHVAKTIWTTN